MGEMNNDEKMGNLTLPNILYPHSGQKVDERSRKDTRFYSELQLDKIVDSVCEKTFPIYSWKEPTLEKAKNELIMRCESLFTELHDIETANYRSGVFLYFLKHPGQLEVMRGIFESSLKYCIRHQDGPWAPQFKDSIERLVFVEEIAGLSEKFGKDLPEALNGLKEYLSGISNSDWYKEFLGVVKKLLGGVEVELHIRLSPDLEIEEVVSGSLVKTAGPEGNLRAISPPQGTQVGIQSIGDRAIENFVIEALSKEYNHLIQKLEEQVKNIISLIPSIAFYVGFADQFASFQKKGYPVCRPTLKPESYGRTFIKDARHPLIQKRPLVGNDISYDTSRNVVVITGATYAGKTAYVGTIGINQTNAETGLLVFGSEAQVSMRDNILTNIDPREDISAGESAHSKEMGRMNDIFDIVTPRSLVLLNEPCRGNIHQAAVEQTTAFVMALEVVGCPTFIATHMHELAELVEKNKFSHTKNCHFPFSGTPPNISYSRKLTDGKSPVNYGHNTAAQMNLCLEGLIERARKRKGM